MYKVKTPSVVISELFRWWLWHLGPDAGFLLTLGHVSRSYRSKGTVGTTPAIPASQDSSWWGARASRTPVRVRTQSDF